MSVLPPSSAARLYLFGAPRLEVAGTVVEPDTRKALALLAYLALVGQPQSRETLAALFWPEQDEEHARISLRRALWSLRQVTASDFLESDRRIVAISPSAQLWVDVLAFEQWATKGEVKGGAVPAPSLEADRAAIALYHADFLAGFTLPDAPDFDQWQTWQAERLRQLMQATLDHLIGASIAGAEYAQALPYAQRRLALDPLNEAAHRTLMQLYGWTEQWTAGLHQYDECVRQLQIELGVTPEAETMQLAAALRAHQVTPPQPPVPQVDASALPAQLPFVGREQQYQQIVHKLSQVSRRRGQLILVEGEPGIGKSRLVAEVAREAQRQGLHVAFAACYEMEQGTPYQPVPDLIDHLLARQPDLRRQLPAATVGELALLVPELAAQLSLAIDPSANFGVMGQTRLLRALLQLLESAAGGKGLMVIIEDIHWADHATRQFLHHTARHLSTLPILLVLSYREEARAADPAFAELIHNLEREPHTLAITLNRLAAPTVHALTISVVGDFPSTSALSQWLQRETDGNPFFLSSILQVLPAQEWRKPEVIERLQNRPQPADGVALTLPAALMESVRSRLRRIPDAHRRLLEYASVWGRRFSFRLLQLLSQEEELALLDKVEYLLQHRLLREQFAEYDFVHDKIREVIYKELSATRAVLLHRKLYEVLAKLAAGGEAVNVVDLATHAERGRLLQAAIRHLLQAGERAANLFALAEALNFYDRAEALASEEPPPLEAQFDLLAHRGLVLTHIGECNRAIADLQGALALTRRQINPQQEGQILAHLGMAYRRNDNFAPAIESLQAALVLANQSGDEASSLSILYNLGKVHWSRGENRQALAIYQQASELYSQLGITSEAGIQLLIGLSDCHWTANRLDEAHIYLERALMLARQLGHRYYEAQIRMLLVMLDGILIGDKSQEARIETEQVLDLMRQIGMEWLMIPALATASVLCRCTGDFQAAVDYLEQSLHLANRRDVPESKAISLQWKGVFLLDLNLPQQALAIFEQTLPIFRDNDSFRVHYAQADLAIAKVRTGGFTLKEQLPLYLEIATELGQIAASIQFLQALVQLSLAQGRPQEALEYAHQWLALAEAGHALPQIARAHCVIGEAKRMMGEFAEAEAALQQALALAEQLGHPRLRWEVYEALIRFHQMTNEQERVSNYQEQISRIIQQIAQGLGDTELREAFLAANMQQRKVHSL